MSDMVLHEYRKFYEDCPNIIGDIRDNRLYP